MEAKVSLKEVPVVVIDTETTGLYPDKGARLLEVAALRFDPDGSTAMFTTLVDPGSDVTIEATEIHGIDRQDLHGAPTFGAVAEVLDNWVTGAVLVGHNVSFDIGFLVAEYGLVGREFPTAPYVCTKEGARKLLPIEKHRLGDCCNHLKIDISGWHAADADVRATAELFWHLLDVAESNGRGQVARVPWFEEQAGPLVIPPGMKPRN